MEPLYATAIILVLTLALMMSGMFVGLALMVSGLIGLYVFRDNMAIASNVFFDSTNSFTLTAVPLFIFLGEILVGCGASGTIFRGTSRLLSWAPGGLLHANLLSCTMFSAISGSSPATAATIGSVALPELKKRGYDQRLSLGSLAAGGTLGILIPPSINMIVYGMIANVSIGQLFISGVFPGILMVGLFMIYVAIRVMRQRDLAPVEYQLTLRGILIGLVELWPVWFLAFVVLGGIFFGIFTPTEAAAVGTAGALLIAAGLRKLTWSMLVNAMGNTVSISSKVLIIYVGAMVLGNFLGVMGSPQQIARFVLDAELDVYQVLLMLLALYLVLGAFLDGISMMVLTVPTVMPLILGLGIDPIWFGVALVILCECGMITPPMGLNLFVIQGIAKSTLGEVVYGVMPFFGLMLFTLVVITIFPQIALWLPGLMIGG